MYLKMEDIISRSTNIVKLQDREILEKLNILDFIFLVLAHLEF